MGARPDREAQSRKERAFETLREWVIYTDLAPGAPLNERELSEKLGISRTPLREILMRLAYLRLVVLEPGRGAFVAPIDTGTIQSIFEVRIPLEKTIAALAASRANDDQIAELARLVAKKRAYDLADDYAALIRADQKFHQTLAACAANPLLSETLDSLHGLALRYWYVHRGVIGEDYRDTANLERIMYAVRDRDPQAAAAAMGDHLAGFLAQYQRKLADGVASLAAMPL